VLEGIGTQKHRLTLRHESRSRELPQGNSRTMATESQPDAAAVADTSPQVPAAPQGPPPKPLFRYETTFAEDMFFCCRTEPPPMYSDVVGRGILAGEPVVALEDLLKAKHGVDNVKPAAVPDPASPGGGAAGAAGGKGGHHHHHHKHENAAGQLEQEKEKEKHHHHHHHHDK